MLISLGITLVVLTLFASTVRVSYLGSSHSTPFDSVLDLLIGGTLITGLVIGAVGILQKVKSVRPSSDAA